MLKNDDVSVFCKKCNDLKKHEIVIKTEICEEWQCKDCGSTRLFGVNKTKK
jgi:RNase P subunit RPR2